MKRNITTQKEIVDLFWRRSGKLLTKETYGRLFSILKNILIERIVQSDSVELRGFGIFYKKRYAAHIKKLCNDFHTGEYREAYVPENTRVKFRSARYLKRRVNP